jgi:hypothetical protein
MTFVIHRFFTNFYFRPITDKYPILTWLLNSKTDIF